MEATLDLANGCGTGEERPAHAKCEEQPQNQSTGYVGIPLRGTGKKKYFERTLKKKKKYNTIGMISGT